MPSAVAGAVEVAPVRGWRALGRFIEVPFELHAGTPWVPPLKLERRMFLTPRLNAYSKHGESRLFLALREGRAVGRISAQVDRAYNEFHKSRTGMFGFIEFEDDQEVVEALLAAARGWLRERGCEEMLGPMDFSMNDESGILIEGFELEPLIRQPWHPPYYRERLEEAGLGKAMDLFSYALKLSDREQLRPAIKSLGARALERHGITIRPMSRRRMRKELDLFAEVYNAAWSENWGFVPYGKEDLDQLAFELQWLAYTPGWFMVAEKEGEVIAMAITTMDLNQVLRRMGGRLLPLGWWWFLRRGKICDRLRVGFLGVKPEHQHTGVAAALYVEHFNAAEHTPLKHGEAGWILESNHAMNRSLEAMKGQIVKRYRVYREELGGP